MMEDMVDGNSDESTHRGEETVLGFDIRDLEHSGIFPTEVRSGKFSPIMATKEYLEDISYKVAQIIEDNDRKPLNFDMFLKEYDPDFIPDCDYYTSTVNIDPDVHSRQVGHLLEEEAQGVIDCKIHCAECPLSTQCLAISMTGIQITRPSKTERTIPPKNGDTETPSLVMDDFLIFGGLTPQERRIVFDKVCDILEEKDNFELQRYN